MRVMWKPRASQLITSYLFCWESILLVSKLIFFFSSIGAMDDALWVFRALCGKCGKKTPGTGRNQSKGRAVLLAVLELHYAMPGSCHKCRTAQVGRLDTQTWREQGKTEFGIQKGIAKNTGAVEQWIKIKKKKNSPQSFLLMLIINNGTSSI